MDNPAAAGIDNTNHIFLGYYQKWLDTEESPTTAFLGSSHTIVKDAVGIGTSFFYDEAGLIQTIRASLNGAFHLSLSDEHIFSLGAAARYQSFGFGSPNVADVINFSDVSASNINLSLGLNYQFRFGNESNSFLNLYAFFPQFPASIDLKEGSSGEGLLFSLNDNIAIQANLHLDLGNEVKLIPSIRWQAQPSDNFLEKTQIVDAALGISFLQDKLMLRLGGRNGATNNVYGGIGWRFNQNVKAHTLYELGDQLGASIAAAADFNFGNAWVNIEPKTREEKTPKPIRVKKYTPEYFDLLVEETSPDLIEIVEPSLTDDIFSSSEIFTLGFADNFDSDIDLYNSDNFDIQPIFDVIERVERDMLNDDEVNILEIYLEAKVQKPLDDLNYVRFTGEDFYLNYTKISDDSGLVLIASNHQFSEAELAATKMHFLSEALIQQIGQLSVYPVKKLVNQSSGIADNRQLLVGIKFIKTN